MILQNLAFFFLFGWLLNAYAADSIQPFDIKIQPYLYTSPVEGDADDPAIFVNEENPKESIIFGNDKKRNGGIYGWNLQGKKILFVPLARAINLDIRNKVTIGEHTYNILVIGERLTNTIRVYAISPEMQSLIEISVGGGIPSGYSKNTYGLALYQRPADGKVYVFVVSKNTKENIHQIELKMNDGGRVTGEIVRSFGGAYFNNFGEGMVVDDELGYLYVSDEDKAVLKFDANPEGNSEPLKSFANDDGITADREGLTLYKCPNQQGFLLLSNQGSNNLKVYDRQTNHFLGTIQTPFSKESDGIDVTAHSLGFAYSDGLLVAHNSPGKNFAFYRWNALKEKGLKCPTT